MKKIMKNQIKFNLAICNYSIFSDSGQHLKVDKFTAGYEDSKNNPKIKSIDNETIQHQIQQCKKSITLSLQKFVYDYENNVDKLYTKHLAYVFYEEPKILYHGLCYVLLKIEGLLSQKEFLSEYLADAVKHQSNTFGWHISYFTEKPVSRIGIHSSSTNAEIYDAIINSWSYRLGYLCAMQNNEVTAFDVDGYKMLAHSQYGTSM